MNNEKKAPVRQIKFRGLRVDGKGWAIGWLQPHTNANKIVILQLYNEHDWLRHEVLPETVGQFTGVYDIDKKEIFEHDVVTFGRREGKYNVVYKGDGFIAISHEGDEYGPYTHRLNPINSTNIVFIPKILGNIHEEREVING
ncbi:YopX family protein [Sphingobacterium sp. Lzh-3]|uniref:YopX family protein n=1 Tax=Sphingobacterium sp. Lzh-3 TaxID=3382150 RepID=UPI00398C85E3